MEDAAIKFMSFALIMKILHIVRRYGEVGGMERYVWQLSRAQAGLGHQVTILCERAYEEQPANITVHEIGEILPKPRWLSLLRFGLRVKSWLASNPQTDSLIHSHERVDVHDLTTFHCPPFANVRRQPIWKKLSIRVAMQLYLEWRELAQAKVIVPNSMHSRDQLMYYYPQFRHKLSAPVRPGVEPFAEHSNWSAVPDTGGVIAFVGKEWKRKGLPLAASIVASLRTTRPGLELWVIGPDPDEVRELFAGWNGGYRLMGWRDTRDFIHQIDVLLHPAQAEPYGMVISEAMAARVPVVISGNCGAAIEVTPAHGFVLPAGLPLQHWVAAVESQLIRTTPPPAYGRNWKLVAGEYDHIYSPLASDTPRVDMYPLDYQATPTSGQYPAPLTGNSR